MNWNEFGKNLSGPNNSHFTHIKQACPTVNVALSGSQSAALVGEARLHVLLTATDESEYKKAKALVEDLVKAVVEVGADACIEDPESRSLALKEVRIIEQQ
jgi:hypothetical protein